MGLNIIENSDVMQFIESVEDERMKELLNRMHCEYYRYVRIGTPEQCEKYKDLCDLKPSDYIRLLDNCTKAFKEELECKEKFYKSKIAELEKKKKGNESRISYGKIEVIYMKIEGMKYTEALRKLNDVMQGREDIKEVKFDKENNMFEVVDTNGHIHMCFGDEFSR